MLRELITRVAVWFAVRLYPVPTLYRAVTVVLDDLTGECVQVVIINEADEVEHVLWQRL